MCCVLLFRMYFFVSKSSRVKCDTSAVVGREHSTTQGDGSVFLSIS